MVSAAMCPDVAVILISLSFPASTDWNMEFGPGNDVEMAAQKDDRTTGERRRSKRAKTFLM